MREPKLTLVVACALVDADKRVLIAQRPEGKTLVGLWEFPGGKVEPGERPETTLIRELHEEIGITIGHAVPWRVLMMDYPHARVRLNFCKVFEWAGELQMHEGQSFAWQSLPVIVQPVLPGTVPVLAWFAEERGFGGATC